MTPLPQPDVILTHESDLDGLLSGALLQRLGQNTCSARTSRWRRIITISGNSASCANGPPGSRTSPLSRASTSRIGSIIDHHVTETAPKNARLIHDVNKSAGLLCYELCRQHGIGSPALDRLVHLNNVADLFLEDDPDFEIAGDYANLVKIYQFWNLHTLIGGDIEKLLDHPLLEVMAVKRRIENPLGFEWSKSNITEISPTVGFVDTVVGNNNLIVHQLLEQQATKYPVLVTLFRRGNAVFASFRSRNGEALKVAEKFQGGGHANAAGAILPKSVRNIPDGVEYLRQVLNPKNETQQSRLNSLESLFAGIEAEQKK